MHRSLSLLQTGFLPGPNGSLHVSVLHPANHGACLQWVLHVPAFGEEMNKSRHIVVRQARAMAAQGMTVVVPDLVGTGDSAGNLEQVTWRGWLDDINYLADWARGQGAAQLTLWGHRMGCLLAADAAHRLEEAPHQLLYWQPVHNGKQHMAQFLRLRMAAGLSKGGAESVAFLRESLLEGKPLEVAGYTLPAGLFREIESLALAKLPVPAGVRIRILEVVSETGKLLLPVTATLVDQWNQAGIDCRAETVQGDPFWMTQELGFAPELIEKTTHQLTIGDDVDSIVSSISLAEPGRAGIAAFGLSSTARSGEHAVVFSCGKEQLAGVLHGAAENSVLGVLIVVGGPQYRVGSHRQFVYLAQFLASHGVPVLRFDYRGMGDSSGELHGFEHVNDDIRSAIDALQGECPQVTDVVIWGLCDAATAAVFYAAGDGRVKGLILANPWVHSEQGAAKAYLKHYYVQRLLQREFWSKVFSGNYSFSKSISSAWDMVKSAFAGRSADEQKALGLGAEVDSSASGDSHSQISAIQQNDLVPRFAEALDKYTGEVFFILSGNDLTAAEFTDSTRSDRKLRRLMKRHNIYQVTLPTVDHTFSRAEWRDRVERISAKVIRQIAEC